MGDMADYYIDYVYDPEWVDENESAHDWGPITDLTTWTSAKGEQTKIADMTDDYLLNVIEYLRKCVFRGWSPSPYLVVMEVEAERRKIVVDR